MHLIIATQDTTNKEDTDFICDGIEDEKEIQVAVDTIEFNERIDGLTLQPGTYYVRESINIGKVEIKGESNERD